MILWDSELTISREDRLDIARSVQALALDVLVAAFFGIALTLLAAVLIQGGFA